MITLRDFKMEDWLGIEDAVEPFMPMIPPNQFLELTNRGISVTAMEDGSVMACGGITFINEQEGTVWVKVSEKCLEKSFRWARIIKETFKIMMDSIEDLKVSTYILNGFCKGARLAKLIGLNPTDERYTYNGNIYYKFKAVL